MTEKDLKIEIDARLPGWNEQEYPVNGRVDENGAAIIDPTCRKIPDNAYRDNLSLKSLVIPEGIEAIGENAFACCANLEIVHLPDSLVEIGSGAFGSCYSLKDVNISAEFDSSKALRRIASDVFLQCDALGVLKWGHVTLHGDVDSGKGVVPDGVTSVSGYALMHSLESIDIPEGVVVISTDAFNCCRNLASVKLSSTVECIGDNAFACCTSLKEIILPNNVRRICTSAFSCSGITRIVIPASVGKIESYIFKSCRGLEEVIFEGTPSMIGDNLFENCPRLKRIVANNEIKKLLESGGAMILSPGYRVPGNCEIVSA